MSKPMRAALGVVAAGAMLLSACGGGSSGSDAKTDGGSGGSGSSETINIVGFAVPEAANTAIAKAWGETEAGKGVKFKTSYGASGDQSRAVENGLKADYVHFSVTSDVTRLVDSGQVDESWDDGPNKGVVSTSVVVIGVEEGNPLGIEDWDDLLQEDVKLITANPGSSGAARWNALAAWGHITGNGGTEEEAEAFVTKLFDRVVALPGSGRDVTQAFLSGTGNVFLTYENEAILARQNGEKFDYVIPKTSILIENPGAVLKDATPKATEWLDFVLSKDGQALFAKTGFRPLATVEGVEVGEVEGANDPANPFPEVENLLTVADDFESWSALSKKFFDENDGIIVKIIAASGKAS